MPRRKQEKPRRGLSDAGLEKEASDDQMGPRKRDSLRKTRAKAPAFAVEDESSIETREGEKGDARRRKKLKVAATQGAKAKQAAGQRKRRKMTLVARVHGPSGSSSSSGQDDSMDEDYVAAGNEKEDKESGEDADPEVDGSGDDGSGNSESESEDRSFVPVGTIPKRRSKGGRGQAQVQQSEGIKKFGAGSASLQRRLQEELGCILDVREVPVSYIKYERLVNTLKSAHTRVQVLGANTAIQTGAAAGAAAPAPGAQTAMHDRAAATGGATAAGEGGAEQQQQEEQRQEFLVKWRHLSYRHAQWVPVIVVQEVAKAVPAVRLKVTRFWRLRRAGHLEHHKEGEEEELWHGVDPQWLSVDRIIAEKGPSQQQGLEEGLEDSEQRLYLVKWGHLGYEHCSWEYEDSLVEEFGAELDAYKVRCMPLHQAAQLQTTVIAARKAAARVQAAACSNGANGSAGGAESAGHQTLEEPQQGKQTQAGMQDQEGHQDQHQQSQQEEQNNKTAAGVGEGSRRFNTTPAWLACSGTLHPYQLEGLNWLFHKWASKENVVLADEMGLGKTVQAVSLLVALYEEEACLRPHLLVVPQSTLRNWERELAVWAPAFNVVCLCGSPAARKIILEHELFVPLPPGVPKKSRAGLQERVKFHVLLTSYELLTAEASTLARIQWEVLIVDEGHRLKNKSSRLFQELQAFKVGFRLLLTGTPLQNNLGELFTLMHFLEPLKFASMQGFEAQLEDLGEEQKVSKLHGLLAPHLLRRMKKDVLRNLPPKQEQVVLVELSPLQKHVYKMLLARHYPVLAGSSKASGELHQLERRTGKATRSLMNLCMELRKCCNHPYLIEGAAPREWDAEDALHHLLASSGKLQLLDRMLARLLAQGHRVLIYSQFTRTLDILEDWLAARKWNYTRIDGSVPGAERQRRIDRFNNDPASCSVFLLSTRSGGVGINLTTADTVVIFDSDWNPHNDHQAQARAHRLGQQRPVAVYRLVTRSTVEERILQTSRRKLVLERLVVHGLSKHSASSTRPTQVDLDDILRYGAKALFSEDATAAGTTQGVQQQVQPSAQVPAQQQLGRIVYDEAALDRLLDRSKLEQKEGVAAEDGGEADDELFKAFKVANFNMVTGDDADEAPNTSASNGGTQGPFSTDPCEEKEKLLQQVCPALEHSTADLAFWDSLLGSKYASIGEEEAATLGRGHRERAKVAYGESSPSSQSEDESSGGVSTDDLDAGSSEEGHALEDMLHKEAVREAKAVKVPERLRGGTRGRAPGMPQAQQANLKTAAGAGTGAGAGAGAGVQADQLKDNSEAVLVCKALDRMTPASAEDRLRRNLVASQGMPPLMAGPTADSLVLHFNERERHTCITTLLNFGLQDPAQMYKYAIKTDKPANWIDLQAAMFAPIYQRLPPSKPAAHVIAYVQLLLQLCNEGPNDSPTFSNGVPKEAVLGPEVTTDLLLSRIAIMHLIRQKYMAWSELPLQPVLKGLTEEIHWKAAHDCALLKGTLMHGFTNYFAIAADRSLGFQEALRSMLGIPPAYDAQGLNLQQRELLAMQKHQWLRKQEDAMVQRLHTEMVKLVDVQKDQIAAIRAAGAAESPPEGIVHKTDMGVKQLKNFLASRNVSTAACVEKQDLVNALQASLDKEQPDCSSQAQLLIQHLKEQHRAMQQQLKQQHTQQLRQLHQLPPKLEDTWRKMEMEWLERRLDLLSRQLISEHKALQEVELERHASETHCLVDLAMEPLPEGIKLPDALMLPLEEVRKLTAEELRRYARFRHRGIGLLLKDMQRQKQAEAQQQQQMRQLPVTQQPGALQQPVAQQQQQAIQQQPVTRQPGALQQPVTQQQQQQRSTTQQYPVTQQTQQSPSQHPSTSASHLARSSQPSEPAPAVGTSARGAVARPYAGAHMAGLRHLTAPLLPVNTAVQPTDQTTQPHAIRPISPPALPLAAHAHTMSTHPTTSSVHPAPRLPSQQALHTTPYQSVPSKSSTHHPSPAGQSIQPRVVPGSVAALPPSKLSQPSTAGHSIQPDPIPGSVAVLPPGTVPQHSPLSPAVHFTPARPPPAPAPPPRSTPTINSCSPVFYPQGACKGVPTSNNTSSAVQVGSAHPTHLPPPPHNQLTSSAAQAIPPCNPSKALGPLQDGVLREISIARAGVQSDMSKAESLARKGLVHLYNGLVKQVHLVREETIKASQRAAVDPSSMPAAAQKFRQQVGDLGSLATHLATALAQTGTPPAPLATGLLLTHLQQSMLELKRITQEGDRCVPPRQQQQHASIRSPTPPLRPRLHQQQHQEQKQLTVPPLHSLPLHPHPQQQQQQQRQQQRQQTVAHPPSLLEDPQQQYHHHHHHHHQQQQQQQQQPLPQRQHAAHSSSPAQSHQSHPQQQQKQQQDPQEARHISGHAQSTPQQLHPSNQQQQQLPQMQEHLQGATAPEPEQHQVLPPLQQTKQSHTSNAAQTQYVAQHELPSSQALTCNQGQGTAEQMEHSHTGAGSHARQTGPTLHSRCHQSPPAVEVVIIDSD